MLDSFANACHAAKDRAVEATARALINQKIEKFGSITKLEICSREKTIRAELDLKGEASPIVISAGRYELVQEPGRSCITLHDLRASREWIGNLLNEYVASRRFPVPEMVRRAL